MQFQSQFNSIAQNRLMASNTLRSSELKADLKDPYQEINPPAPKLNNQRYEYRYYYNYDNKLPSSKSPIASRTSQSQLNGSVSHSRTKTGLEQAVRDEVKAHNDGSKLRQYSAPSNLQLDPRDQKVKIRLVSSEYASLLEKGFKDEVNMGPFEDEVRDWMVDLIQVTTSIGFNHLNKSTLTEKETKNFVAKNILQNVKQMFEDYSQIPLEFREKLMEFVNQESYKIFDHVARKYPQTSSKGVSKRIKSRVQSINNRQSDEYDFLLKNSIQIHFRQDGDYSEDIMKIINKLISFSTEVEDTNYEVFSELMEIIFDSVSFQSTELTAKDVVKLNKDLGLRSLDSIGSEMDCDFDHSMDSKQYGKMKQSQKQVLIGHKIPIGVNLFTEECIKSSKFKVYDSSILRLMTKWAEELRNKINNAEETIFRRMFKFKNIRGRLINLEPTMKGYLYKAAIEEIQNIEEYLCYLKKQNYYLQTIFSQEHNRGKYSKNDTKVGIFAAKMNEIASQYIFKYLNKLIHSLLTIPIKAATMAQSDWEKAVIMSVDLITFKIGDMMRCKCSCSEPEFIKILKVLDLISANQPDILNVVRIKNRLQTENNDILINFLFGGKAECQMQLSVLSAEKKNEKNSSIFSHLIYEIVRAQLGPLSQMATIVVQYDPLANLYSKDQNFSPKLINLIKNQETDLKMAAHLQQRNKLRSKMKLCNSLHHPFVCSTCQKLTVISNPQFFYRDLTESQRNCNECLNNIYQGKCVNGSAGDKIKAHILNKNYQDENSKIFCMNHVQAWDKEGFIKELEEQTQERMSSRWFPRRGFITMLGQKLPKFQLFTCLHERVFSFVLMAGKDEKQNYKLFSVIKLHEQKHRKIQAIKKELKKYFIAEINNASEVEQGGIKYFVCNKPGCCGIRLNPGPFLQFEQMQEYKNKKIIEKSVKQQKNMFYLSYMYQSLEKVDDYLKTVSQKNKLWKIKSNIQAIEVFQCQLTSIETVSMFNQLIDLNIGQNFGIKSLKGIENCHKLKNLACNNCDLQSIEELRGLKKLQCLNLSNSKRLKSIDSLTDHTELLDLFLKNTAITSLAPLSNCLKLQSLDLQSCVNITTIQQVRSLHLSYISIINCTGIQSFDLPDFAIKSLRTIQVSKTDQENELLNFLGNFSLSLPLKVNSKLEQQPLINSVSIDQINNILRTRRTTSSNIL